MDSDDPDWRRLSHHHVRDERLPVMEYNLVVAASGQSQCVMDGLYRGDHVFLRVVWEVLRVLDAVEHMQGGLHGLRIEVI